MWHRKTWRITNWRRWTTIYNQQRTINHLVLSDFRRECLDRRVPNWWCVQLVMHLIVDVSTRACIYLLMHLHLPCLLAISQWSLIDHQLTYPFGDVSTYWCVQSVISPVGDASNSWFVQSGFHTVVDESSWSFAHLGFIESTYCFSSLLLVRADPCSPSLPPYPYPSLSFSLSPPLPFSLFVCLPW